MTVEELIDELQRLPAAARSAPVSVCIRKNITHDGGLDDLDEDETRDAEVEGVTYEYGIATVNLDE